MIRNIFLCSVLALSMFSGCIINGDKPFPPIKGDFLEEIPYEKYIDFNAGLPSGEVFDIRSYGATGDGKTLNTASINETVRAAYANGGGTVLIGDGDYVSGTIILLSNVTLHISKKGILRASHEKGNFDPKNLIYCENATDVRIEGPGKIMGEGEYFWTSPIMLPVLCAPVVSDIRFAMLTHFLSKREKTPDRPSPLIRFNKSTRVSLGNLIIENSPGWTVSFDVCDDVHVRNTVVNNNYHGGNTDGFDIVASNGVDIRDCFISTGDDGIVLKNNYLGTESRPMSDIWISGCEIMSSTNCFKIGTETWSDISGVRVEDCTFFVSGVWPGAISGISIESVDGSKVKDVEVSGITMSNILTPLFIRLGNRNRWGDKDMAGSIEGIRISDVTASGVEFPSIISGIPGLDVKDVKLADISVEYRESCEFVVVSPVIAEREDEYPEAWMFFDVPAYGLWARHVEGLEIDNFCVIPRSKNKRKMLVIAENE